MVVMRGGMGWVGGNFLNFGGQKLSSHYPEADLGHRQHLRWRSL